MEGINPYTSIIPMARALLNHSEAMTIATLIRISPQICDSIIVAATDKVAAYFGFPSGESMTGHVISSLHHPDDLRQTRQRATLRTLQLMPAVDTYPIRGVLPDKRLVGLEKEVTIKTESGMKFWISHHQCTRQLYPTPPPPIPVPDELLTQIFGKFTLLEAEEILRDDHMKRLEALSLTFDASPHQDDVMHSAIRTSGENQDPMLTPLVDSKHSTLVSIGLGETRILPDERYLHRCGNCAYIWISDQPHPRGCPRTRSDSRGPRCGVLDWDRLRVQALRQLVQDANLHEQ